MGQAPVDSTLQDREPLNFNIEAERQKATAINKINRSGIISGTRNNSTESIVSNDSTHSSLTRNLRGIFRKTSSFVSGFKSQPDFSDLGPLTYTPSLAPAREFVFQEESPCDDRKLEKLCATLESGIWLTKITRRKRVYYHFTVKNGTICWKDDKHIDLDSIKDIRTGELAKNYIEDYQVPLNYASSWITIIYQVSNKLKALHVIAANQEDFRKFYYGLLGIVSSRRELMKSISVPDSEQFANIHWKANVSFNKVDEERDTLSFADVRKLCSKFNIYCSSEHLEKFFKLADINSNGLLNFEEFRRFVKLLKNREEVNEIWKSLTGSRDYMDFACFSDFLERVQGETCDQAVFEKLFDKFCTNKGILQEEGFLKFLTSQPYIEYHQEDYSKPLNYYFISSSHNTYLLGKQLGENPTVEGYIQVLQQGCRCIEVDIWDGEEGPVVCHGMLTGSIPLKNVLEVIRKYAFITSPFPLILSLEIHCKKENQLITEVLLKELLGSKIFTGRPRSELPSPLELKHRIILKSKKSKIEFTTTTGDITNLISSSTSSSYDSEYDIIPDQGTKRKGMRRLSLSKKIQVSESLLLISAIHGLKFRNFSLPESKTPDHCFSINEKKLESLVKDENQRLAIDKHNRRHLMRVYPHALRYKSSNFNPTKFWRLGVQMVATNWQTHDLGQQVNEAMFQVPYEKNSLWHSGYVLKPHYLQTGIHKASDILELYENLERRAIRLEIDILSAQLLPKTRETKERDFSFNPFVSLAFICDGSPRQSLEVMNGVTYTETSGTTSQCKENGFNPIWGTKFKITLKDDKLNFVIFTVKAGDSILATCCLKLEHLKRGYRHLPLYSITGERYIFSTLFIKTNYDSLN